MHPLTIRRRERRQKLIDLLGGKCVECGSKDNLEFDHIDPSQKAGRISEMLDARDEKLNAEVEKCQLLCKPCHHKKTLDHKEYGSEAEHGTLWRFRKYHCRCPKCIQANNDYNDYRNSVRTLNLLHSKLVD